MPTPALPSHARLSPSTRHSIAAQIAMSLVSLGPAAAARVFSPSYLGKLYVQSVAAGDKNHSRTIAKIILTRNITHFSGIVDLAVIADHSSEYRDAALDRIGMWLRSVSGIGGYVQS